MTYNTTRRPKFTKADREALLAAHDHRCWWCGEPILPGQPWDVEHKTAREMMPDATADLPENLAPIHAHPATCHKIKTRRDRAIIAKSNRVRQERREPKHPMRSRGFQPGSRKIPTRPFPKRNP